MPRPTKLPLGFALLLWAPLAIAQNNLGELLDAGGKLLSEEEFRQELVQRMLVGPTATGGNIALMYVSNGTVQGNGALSIQSANMLAELTGEWKIDDSGKVCTSMRVGGTNGAALPYRCQFWFKHNGKYFLSDSDTDRQARVLLRTIKQ